MVGLVGCGAEPITPSTPSSEPEVAQSELKRNTAPSAPPGDVAALTKDNAAFAVDLYHQLRGKQGNLFYSPHSISLALAMAYAGARGTTEREMSAALHYRLPQSALHAAFNSLDLELASRGRGAQGKDGGKFRLNIANAIWGERSHKFLASYLDLIALDYGAGLRLVSFREQPEPARLAINDWVARSTEDRIKELLEQGTIDTTTRLVLTNAVYFNAAWRDKFDAKETATGDFTRLDGSKLAVSMMAKRDHLGYAHQNGWRAVELPYDGEQLSMVVLLPDAGLAQAEPALGSDGLAQILGALVSTPVELALPRFKIESSFKLKEALAKLGMQAAFSDADFSGIDGKRELAIADVVHKSFIAIDEAGTEAAAATAVVMVGGIAPGQPEVVRVDRPFLFVIRDIATRAILFVGRVVEPK